MPIARRACTCGATLRPRTAHKFTLSTFGTGLVSVGCERSATSSSMWVRVVRLFSQTKSHMKKFASLLFVAALLSGCAVHTPSGSIVIDPARADRHQGNGGGFCPPGQAKKGNC